MIKRFNFLTFTVYLFIKDGRVLLTVVVSIVSYAEFGPNDHQGDALHFILCKTVQQLMIFPNIGHYANQQ